MPEIQPEYSDIDQLVADLSRAVLDLVDAGTPTPIVLIDGRAGSGKSTLAVQLQNVLFRDGESAPRLIHMDDLYPGWDGLSAGSDYLNRMILRPVFSRKVASWQVFDWAKNERNQWREFAGGTPLIIEGCGSLSAQNFELSTFSVWLEAGEKTRHERWVSREGNDEFWAGWAAQEVDFYAREKSAELATTHINTGV